VGRMRCIDRGERAILDLLQEFAVIEVDWKKEANGPSGDGGMSPSPTVTADAPAREIQYELDSLRGGRTHACGAYRYTVVDGMNWSVAHPQGQIYIRGTA
jgi:hypothetical protein